MKAWVHNLWHYSVRTCWSHWTSLVPVSGCSLQWLTWPKLRLDANVSFEKWRGCNHAKAVYEPHAAVYKWEAFITKNGKEDSCTVSNHWHSFKQEHKKRMVFHAFHTNPNEDRTLKALWVILALKQKLYVYIVTSTTAGELAVSPYTDVLKWCMQNCVSMLALLFQHHHKWYKMKYGRCYQHERTSFHDFPWLIFREWKITVCWGCFVVSMILLGETKPCSHFTGIWGIRS